MPVVNLENYRINYLYYLLPVDNMESVCRRGLLSHNSVRQQGLAHRDIADQQVNNRRAGKEVFGRPLHDYVPLYFTPKNPMLYRRREMQEDIVILCLDKNLIFRDGAIFTDGNAASIRTAFYDDIRYISMLDWTCIRAVRWNGIPDGTRKRCAEVLVPNQVPFNDIQRIVVKGQRALSEVYLALQSKIDNDGDVRVQVEPEIQLRWYFED